METVDSSLLLSHMPAVDQEDYKSRIKPSNCGQPEFYWIFRNMDFERWKSTEGSEVLGLSGPAERRITNASSSVVDIVKEKNPNTQHLVLYFFCSTAPLEASIAITFVNTIIHQLVSRLPERKEKLTTVFLRALFDTIFRGKPPSDPAPSSFQQDVLGEASAEAVAEEILKVPSDGYWYALREAMDVVHDQELSLIVDGLDEIGDQKREFAKGVHMFSRHLRERHSTTRVLLTSRPQAEMKEILSELPCIEYDKERKGSINSHSLRYATLS